MSETINIAVLTTDTGNPAYEIPAEVEYQEVIRALQDDDPARATTIFNPLIQKLVNNIHFVKLFGDGTRVLVNSIEKYDDTELRSMIENFQNYDDTEIRTMYEVLMRDIEYFADSVMDGFDVIYRWMDVVSADFYMLVFELAIKDLIDAGNMKYVVVDRIETANDITLRQGKFGDGKVFI